jgi:hypothetical protein
LYINNIVNDLKIGHTHPLVVGDVTVTTLLYADNIILVSESKEGLQHGLNVLSKFGSSWKLEVNTNKSKIMIFNSNGKSFLNHFKLDNEEYLETVKSYCYLGVTVIYTGNLSQTSKNLMEKGRKAWFKIKKTITLSNPCNLLEKLFDSLVVPIILYGSEVWGVGNKFRNSDPFEHLHLKFIKDMLGVPCKTTNVACLAETTELLCI